MKNETKEKDILCKLTQAFLIGKKIIILELWKKHSIKSTKVCIVCEREWVCVCDFCSCDICYDDAVCPKESSISSFEKNDLNEKLWLRVYFIITTNTKNFKSVRRVTSHYIF